jgi:hypothetical protein
MTEMMVPCPRAATAVADFFVEWKGGDRSEEIGEPSASNLWSLSKETEKERERQ